MLKLVRLMALVLLPLAISAQDLNLEDIWLKYAYYANYGDQIDFQNTSSNYTQLVYDKDGYQKLKLFDVTSGKAIETLYDGSKGDRSQMIIDNYELSFDDKMVLLATKEAAIYRYSTNANYYAYSIDTDELHPLSSNGKQMYPHFSPNNKVVAFIRDNNVFYKSFDINKEVQVTFDGKVNYIINGYSDWVYEEEFALTRAFEWSRDGNQLFFIQFDESNVKEFSFITYDDLYPQVKSFKYPKAGEENSKVKLKLFDLPSQKLKELTIPFDFEYIPRIYSTDNGFAFLLLNRHQNHLQLIEYNVANNSFDIIYEEKDERYIDLPIVLEYLIGNNWVISSEKDGFNHLYTIINKNVNAITSGNFEVTNFYGIDKEGWVYYQSNEESEVERQVFKININSKEKIALTTDPGTHEATFSGDKKYFIDHYSADGIPYQIAVKENQNGKSVRSIEENQELKNS